LLFGRRGELLEVQRDVDAGEEGLVERLNTVGREEQNATVVLDVSKASIIHERVTKLKEEDQDSQDSDHRIPLEIMQRPLLQKHVRFINKHNSLPGRRDIKDSLQLLI